MMPPLGSRRRQWSRGSQLEALPPPRTHSTRTMTMSFTPRCAQQSHGGSAPTTGPSALCLISQVCGWRPRQPITPHIEAAILRRVWQRGVFCLDQSQCTVTEEWREARCGATSGHRAQHTSSRSVPVGARNSLGHTIYPRAAATLWWSLSKLCREPRHA